MNAGWYPDPSDPSLSRWWDGTRWTEHTRRTDAGYGAPAATPSVPTSAPTALGGYQAYPAYPSAPAAYLPPKVDVPTNTVWIWLVIVAGLLPLLLLLMIDWQGYISAVGEMAARGGTPDFAMLAAWQGQTMAVSLLGWIPLAASVVFSWLDWRELGRRGVERPFHWAWSFFILLTGLQAVYVIGRTVVLSRRTREGGWPPLWAWIASCVVSVVISVWWSIWFIGMLFAEITPYLDQMGSYSG